jgi:hypothetical protein
MNSEIQFLVDLLKEGLPVAREALKKMRDARVSASVESLDTFVNNAMAQLLSISAVIDEKDRHIYKLQAELRSLRNWDDFASKVRITEIDNGKFAWTLKEPTNETEAKLRYCTKCFAEQRQSILQLKQLGNDIYFCPDCSTHLATPSTRPKPTIRIHAPRPSWLTNR